MKRSIRVTPEPIPWPFSSSRTGFGSSPSIEGLEQHELSVFLQVLNQARDLRPKGDDLLTILWEKDLKYFTYSYIDILAEGVDLDLPAGGAGLAGGFEKIIEEEVGGEKGLPKPRSLSGGREEAQGGPGR